MSQHTNQPQDLEKGNGVDGDPLSTPDLPSQGESVVSNSSEQIFSMYSKVMEEQDSKVTKRLQEDTDGILIFTGLFSASVAAILTVTVQDLRPNSQDTSAFYLGNIYEVLANPNISISSSVARPPPFSPPRYAIWVNSLWLLSFVLSLLSALMRVVVQQWVRRYITVTQPAWCSPEKRARMRAFFINDMMWSTAFNLSEYMLFMLYISVFLFFGGLCVLLFNTNHAVFWSMVGLILGYLCFVGYIIQVSEDFALIPLVLSMGIWYNKESIEKEVPKRSWALDVRILCSLIQALGDDEAMEKFFEAIPGFFNSNLVKHRNKDFEPLFEVFWNELNGFLSRTLSTNSIAESVKSHRLDISMNVMKVINSLRTSSASSIPSDILVETVEGWDQVPQVGEMVPGQLMTHCFGDHERTAHYAQCIVAKMLASVPGRNDRWIQSATGAFGLLEHDLRDYINHGKDSLSLAISIHLIRQLFCHRFCDRDALKAFSKFDIRNTLPGLQHNFCTLWNEIVQEARNRGYNSTPVKILRDIRHLYIDLHQGTDAAPTAFSASTPTFTRSLNISGFMPRGSFPSGSFPRGPFVPGIIPPGSLPTSNLPPGMPIRILLHPSSYPLCDIASHRPDSTAHLHITNSRVSTQPDDSSDAPAATSLVLPVHTGRCPISEVLLTTSLSVSSTPTLAPGPASTPPVPGMSLASTDAGAASTFDPFPPSLSTAGFSIPISHLPSRVPLSLNAELLAILSSITSSRSTGNAPLPLVRARGLVNAGSMCFANAVLQLLVHSPLFWNLFRELGDLKGQLGAGGPETGSGATPLVDATVRFFEEFIFKGSPQRAASANPRKLDKVKNDHNVVDSFEPTYMYDAMKGKRQLRNLLNGEQRDAEEFFRLYLDALDEELLALLSFIGTHKLASVASEVKEREVSRSGLTEIGKRGLTGSPITRIFGGKSCWRVRAPDQSDAITLADWRSLQLDIRPFAQPGTVYTVQDALVHLSQHQPVSGSSERSRQLLFDVLPPVLVLHLKRFLYDASSDGIDLISKPVQFAPELEIPPEIMTPVSGKSAEPVHYKLYGVLYRQGESAGSGHYTVDVLHQNHHGGGGESWLHIDDETVSAMQHEMFGSHDNELGDNRCAYMLFYCRTASTGT